MLKINAVCRCYKELIYDAKGKIIAYEYPFDGIKVKKLKKGNFQVPEFYIVVDLCIKDKFEEENPIFTDANEKLDFEIRLTKCDMDEDKRNYFTILSFCITPTYLVDRGFSRQTSMDVVNYREIITVPKIDVDCTGDYVLKVLYNDKDSKLTAQCATPITFYENE